MLSAIIVIITIIIIIFIFIIITHDIPQKMIIFLQAFRNNTRYKNIIYIPGYVIKSLKNPTLFMDDSWFFRNEKYNL